VTGREKFKNWRKGIKKQKKKKKKKKKKKGKKQKDNRRKDISFFRLT